MKLQATTDCKNWQEVDATIVFEKDDIRLFKYTLDIYTYIAEYNAVLVEINARKLALLN